MKCQPQWNAIVHPLSSANYRRAESPPKAGRPSAIRILVCAAAIVSIALAAQPARSQNDVPAELTVLGEHGEAISRVREQTFGILDSENSCSAWFREVAPDAADIFNSLHYKVEQDRPTYVLHMKDGNGMNLFKHPWTA